MKKAYTDQAQELINWLDVKIPEMRDHTFDNTLEGARDKMDKMMCYLAVEKPDKAANKLAVEGLLSNLQVKLRNAQRPAWVPPEGLGLEVLAAKWVELQEAETAKEKAIRDEVARQEKLEELARRWKDKQAKMARWVKEKTEFAQERPVIDTLLAAQLQLKLLDGHDQQYEASKPRMEDLKNLADEMVSLGYKDAAIVQEQLSEVQGKWADLGTASQQKREWLNDCLEKQSKMEKLRLAFAEKITALNRWYNDTIQGMADAVFGDTLDEVVVYEDQLNKNVSNYHETSSSKKQELEDLMKELVELGAKDNKYTMLTLEDVNLQEQKMEEAIGKYKEYYTSELKRQQDMEAKRKEFAAAAQKMKDFLDTQKSTLDALTGEPEPLSEEINKIWEEGNPQKIQLDTVKRIYAEELAMQITTNRYTPHTPQTLAADSTGFNVWVKNFLLSLLDERSLKIDYAERAGKLTAWVKDSCTKLDDHVCENTLAGAQTKLKEFSGYRSSEKPPKSAEKHAVLTLHKTIVRTLEESPHHRPAFVPAEGTSPNDITALWGKLEDSEKAREQYLKTELSRQESLHALHREFVEEATELALWGSQKSEYLCTIESIDSLEAAENQVHLLQSYEEEHESSLKRIESLRKIHDALAADNFHKIEEVAQKLAEIDAQWKTLVEQKEAKKKKAEEDLKTEQRKEELRLEFALEAKDFIQWANLKLSDIERSAFGDTLEAVQDFKQVMDENDTTCNAKADEKLLAIEKTLSQLSELHVTDNPHTSISKPDIDAALTKLRDGQRERQEKYGKELTRQEAMEAKRKEFAEAAQKLKEFLDSQRSEIDSLNGEPTELATSVATVWQEGAPQQVLLDALRKLYSEELTMQITSNKYTTHTTVALAGESTSLNTWVKNYLLRLEEEKKRKSEYLERVAKISKWMKDTIEKLAERTIDNTLPGAQTLSKELEAYRASEKPPKSAEKEAVLTLHKNIVRTLEESPHHRPAFVPPEGSTPADIITLWTKLEEAEKSREDFITKELQRQEKLHAAQKQFFEESSELLSWGENKMKFLTTEEKVDTLVAAQIQVDLLETYEEEHRSSGPRVSGLHELHDELINDNYCKSEEVKQRMQEVDKLWSDLDSRKAERLLKVKEDLRREQEKEDLRVDFASMAKEFSERTTALCNKARASAFGETLEDVVKYQETLDKEDEAWMKEANEKKEAIVNKVSQMKTLDVTDNVHTNFSLSDIEEMFQQLQSEIKDRKEKYTQELDRQKAMEAKRIEFANATVAFKEFLDSQRSKIDALNGDPEPLQVQINEIWQDGKPQQEKLEALQKLFSEELAMQITSNKYTTHTVVSLSGESTALNVWVKNFLQRLTDEKNRKIDYADRAAKLVKWVTETITQLENWMYDNTLQGVRILHKQLAAYRSSEKPTESSKKQALLTLHKTIVRLLEESPHHRPVFVPPEGLAPNDIVTLWNKLEETEKAREDYLAAELRRQEKLHSLQKKFFEECNAQVSWGESKSAYLVAEEPVDTLVAAQIQLQLLQNYEEEHKVSLTKNAELHALHDSIIGDNYCKAEDVTKRMSEVDALWIQLEKQKVEKMEKLKEILKREQEKEELRMDFALMAKEFSERITAMNNKISASDFGNNLEAVVKYKEDMTKEDEVLLKEATDRKEAIGKKIQKMEEMKVTDNVHTNISNKDIDDMFAQLQHEIDDRHEKYAKELAHQEAMEAKRKEFAAAAEALIHFLESELTAMGDMTGEPEPLTDDLKTRFKDGVEATELLKAAESVHSQCLAMEISENKYTKHTVQSLTAAVADYRKFVIDFMNELEIEKKEKEAYAAKAAKLNSWLTTTTRDLEDRNFDNTLVGAQGKMRQFTEWRSATKPPKVVERGTLTTAHNKVVQMLEASKHKRPKFQPAPEHTLEAIDQQFEQLNKEEKSREEALVTELKRQEKLSGLFKDFTLKSNDLRAWCETKEAYLKKEEDVGTVISAQIQVDLLSAYAVEYDQSKSRVEKLKELHQGLEEGHFRDVESVKVTLDSVVAIWESLEPLHATKQALLKEAVLKETEKEALRVEFSRLATEFDRWTRSMVDKVSQFAFGSTLDAVLAYKASKETDDGQILSEAQTRKKAFDDLWAKIQASGITDNVHTLIGDKDANVMLGLVTQAIEKRTVSYEHEVEHQQAMEASRVSFAEAVGKYVNSVEALTKALEAVTGEPDEKANIITSTYAGGESQRTLLSECEAIDSQGRELGVIDNKHTPLTIATLRAKQQKLEAFVANLLASTAQEKVMKERKLEREREWAHKEKVEGLVNQYHNGAHTLAQWLENATEVIGYTPKFNTVPEVIEQEQQVSAIERDLPDKQKLFTELGELVSQIGADGGDTATRHAKLTENWGSVEGGLESKKQWLTKEKTVQEEAQKLRASFAEKANAYHGWVLEENSVTLSGELEAQLDQITRQEAAVNQKGEALLVDLTTLDKQMVDSAVTPDSTLSTHTASSLKGELTQLKQMLQKRRELLTQQLDAKRHGGMSPDELAECHSLFSQFDKDKTGQLKWFHFKGILQALGEEMSDDEIKKVVAEFDADGNESISFDEFLTFMKRRRTDTDSKAEIVAAFRAIAGNKDTVTLSELQANMPPAQAEYLARVMPQKEGGLDYTQWADGAFL